jgi:hypothetical protein
MNLQSSTLLSEDTGVPFDQLQAEQIRLYLAAWAEQGWTREPRVSVSRSVLPITEDIDRVYFGEQGHDDQIGLLDGVRSLQRAHPRHDRQVHRARHRLDARGRRRGGLTGGQERWPVTGLGRR